MSGPVIYCGDQMQYELDNINTPPKERADWPYPSYNALDWAEAFCKKNPGFDEGVALAWFSAALMRGYDERQKRAAEEIERLQAALKEIAAMENEHDEWDGAEKFWGAREIARQTVGKP